MAQRGVSQTQRAIRRFKRNLTGVISLGFIAFSVIIALLGYAITPDSTPDANDQVPELDMVKPGFSVKMLKVRDNVEVEQRNFFSAMFLGQPNPYRLQPIEDYQLQDDSIRVQVYRGKMKDVRYTTFGLADVVYPVTYTDGGNVTFDGQTVAFNNIYGERISVPLAELQEQAVENIVTHKYWLGTDHLGRDVLSRIILGVRVSLSVGVVAVVISLFIGVIFGSLAGFYQAQPPDVNYAKLLGWIAILIGIVTLITAIVNLLNPEGTANVASLARAGAWLVAGFVFVRFVPNILKWRWRRFPVDDIVMWFINVMWSIPTLLLAFAIMLVFGQEFWQIYIAVGLTMWVEVARIVRGQVLGVREQQYIEASKGLGFSDVRTILLHVLPNITGPLTVIAAANFAAAILIEAGLSFIGIGVQPPMPSWGTMLNEYKTNIASENAHLVIIPGIAIMLLVLAFNLVGNGLRDALDVRSSMKG